MLGLPPRDGDAFLLFYTTYLLIVFRALERIGVRKSDLRDIAQQVFLKIYKNIDKIPDERVQSWIEVICRQQAADHYRLHRNRFEIPGPNVGEELPHGDDVHEQFERCETTAIVRKVLESMDAPLREVLIRYEFQDESLESIAKSLGIVRNTVHARLVEAKRIFAIRAKKLMGDERHTSAIVPLFVGTEALSDADLQTPAFVEEMRAGIWKGIASELGLDEHAFGSTLLESRNPTPREDRKSIVRRVFQNRGVIASSSAVAGFIAALLWPRDVPATANHWAMVTPAIVVESHEVTPDPSKSEPLSVVNAAPANTVVDAPTPSAAKTMLAPAVSLPNSQIDRETRKLEEAREFIVKARYADALAVLARHQQEFPQSQFAATRRQYITLAQEGQKRAIATTATTP